MKITALKTVVVNAEMRNWVFVKIETDQPGLYGWGEASLEWKTRAVVGAVEDYKTMLIGEDPLRIEHLWQMLYKHSFWRVGAIGMSAISGIEQALWDIEFFKAEQSESLMRSLRSLMSDQKNRHAAPSPRPLRTLGRRYMSTTNTAIRPYAVIRNAASMRAWKAGV